MELPTLTNPVGFLQEYCQKQYLPPPKYILINQVGLDHCKKFTVSCKLEDNCVEGDSHSKKTAKREAAQNMITFLKEKGILLSSSIKPKVKPMYEVYEEKAPEVVKEEPVQVQTSTTLYCSNPVGMLQEYCSKRRLMFPIYRAVPNESEMFVIACTLEKLTLHGSGRQKKLAKSIAASEVLKAIIEKQSTPTDEKKKEMPNTEPEEKEKEIPKTVPEAKEQVAEDGSMSPTQSFIAA